MRRLDSIRREITRMSEKEAYRLWRMARAAENHGCKSAKEIREEARIVITASPEMVISSDFQNSFKYAFR